MPILTQLIDAHNALIDNYNKLLDTLHSAELLDPEEVELVSAIPFTVGDEHPAPSADRPDGDNS
jgi:hypothetical protein